MALLVPDEGEEFCYKVYHSNAAKGKILLRGRLEKGVSGFKMFWSKIKLSRYVNEDIFRRS